MELAARETAIAFRHEAREMRHLAKLKSEVARSQHRLDVLPKAPAR
jgi:hypothetical protein